MNAPYRNVTAADQRVLRPVAWWLRLLGAMPGWLLRALAALIGALLYHVVRFRRAIASDNLRGCFPAFSATERRRLLARHYREWTASALELPRLARFTVPELRTAVRFEAFEALHAALAAGRPVMVLSAHQGNWEWMLQRVAVEFAAPVVCAYKPLRSARLNQRMLELRQRFGAELSPAKSLARQLARLRGRPHIAALAADQMPASSPSRLWLSFLGRPTAFYPGPAELSLRYGYDIWYLAMERVAPERYRAVAQPIARAEEGCDAAELTRRYALRLEAAISAHPHDWAWGHRRWKDLPGAAAPVRS